MKKASVRRAFEREQDLLGRRLRELREAQDKSLEEAAEAAGIHPKHLQRVESGIVNVTLATLVALSATYDLPLPNLFTVGRRRRSGSDRRSGKGRK